MNRKELFTLSLKGLQIKLAVSPLRTNTTLFFTQSMTKPHPVVTFSVDAVH